jgi:hypothetical protein
MAKYSRGRYRRARRWFRNVGNPNQAGVGPNPNDLPLVKEKKERPR